MNRIKNFFSSSHAKKGIAALIVTVIFTSAVIGLNFAATALQNAFPFFSADMTSNSMFRLSPETKSFLDGIDDDITLTVLIDEEELIATGTYFNQANSIVRQFAAYSPRISLVYDDYMDDTASIENRFPDADISESSVFVVKSSKRYCVLDVTDIFNVSVDNITGSLYIASSKVEQALTTGILAAITDDLTEVTFISGLGGDEDEEGYSALFDLLEENAFSVRAISLVTSEIPENTDIVVIYAPANDLDKENVDKIRKFLDNGGEGGKTLIYISGYDNVDKPNIETLLEEYKLALADGVMYETDTDMIAYADNPYMSIVSYGEEIFYDNLKNQTIPFISPYTRAVQVISSEATVMLYASTQSAVFPFDADENFDLEGAVTGTPVVAAAIGNHNNSNVVLFGSSEAFSSACINSNSFNNGAYFVNVCSTVAERGEDFNIVIESKSLSPSALIIKYQLTSDILIVFFRWVLPLVLLAIAAFVFVKRRRR